MSDLYNFYRFHDCCFVLGADIFHGISGLQLILFAKYSLVFVNNIVCLVLSQYFNSIKYLLWLKCLRPSCTLHVIINEFMDLTSDLMVIWIHYAKTIFYSFVLQDCLEMTIHMIDRLKLVAVLDKGSTYRQVSNIRCTLVDNKIVDHSDVVGASPVGAAPTTSSFST